MSVLGLDWSRTGYGTSQRSLYLQVQYPNFQNRSTPHHELTMTLFLKVVFFYLIYTFDQLFLQVRIDEYTIDTMERLTCSVQIAESHAMAW